jgi:hypothetical protein
LLEETRGWVRVLGLGLGLGLVQARVRELELEQNLTKLTHYVAIVSLQMGDSNIRDHLHHGFYWSVYTLMNPCAPTSTHHVHHVHH